MLKTLKIENFENHENTVINFSSGFNLICGPSNSGKTSIIRALRLLLYNQWFPEALRVGAKNCKITLDTDRGSVSVLRGKENKWTIVDIDGNVKEFDKIGKNILDEVIEITGIKPVKLGSFECTPNIMDQLEGHFLLAELDGESVSGSLRAQIVDEVSGLSGMEELIKQISLENLRISKSIKEIEITNENIIKKLHDKEQLQNEIDKINKIDELFKKYEKIKDKVENLKTINKSYVSYGNTLSDMMFSIKKFSKIDIILEMVLNLGRKISRYNEMKDTISSYNILKKTLLNLEKSVSTVDYGYMLNKIGEIKNKNISYCNLKSLRDDYVFYKKQLTQLEKQIDNKDYALILSKVARVKEIFELYKNKKSTLNNYKSACLDLARQETVFGTTEKALNKIMDKYVSEIKSVSICPLTKKPTKKSCFEEISL